MWFAHQFKSKNQEVDFLAFDTDTVNSEEWFDPYNIDIHGIRDDYVVSAPNFISLSSSLNDLPRERAHAIYIH